jgi:hypothetical protein
LAFYTEYKAAAGNLDQQQRWANQLTWEIARHSIGEELVVYPLLEKALGEKGHALAEHDREDHQVIYFSFIVHVMSRLQMMT